MITDYFHATESVDVEQPFPEFESDDSWEELAIMMGEEKVPEPGERTNLAEGGEEGVWGTESDQESFLDMTGSYVMEQERSRLQMTQEDPETQVPGAEVIGEEEEVKKKEGRGSIESKDDCEDDWGTESDQESILEITNQYLASQDRSQDHQVTIPDGDHPDAQDDQGGPAMVPDMEGHTLEALGSPQDDPCETTATQTGRYRGNISSDDTLFVGGIGRDGDDEDGPGGWPVGRTIVDTDAYQGEDDRGMTMEPAQCDDNTCPVVSSVDKTGKYSGKQLSILNTNDNCLATPGQRPDNGNMEGETTPPPKILKTTPHPVPSWTKLKGDAGRTTFHHLLPPLRRRLMIAAPILVRGDLNVRGGRLPPPPSLKTTPQVHLGSPRLLGEMMTTFHTPLLMWGDT